MADFSKEITAAGVGWVNLLATMQAPANGYTGGAVLNFFTIEEELGNNVRIKIGHSSGTSAPGSATDGTPVSSKAETMYQVDAGVAWIYTGGAFTYSIKSHSDVDF